MKTMSRSASVFALVALLSACERRLPLSPMEAPNAPRFAASASAPPQDPVLAKVVVINARLRAQGSKLAIEGMDFFTIGVGRPSIRIHQEGFRRVPNDPRRLADGDNITYLVRDSHGVTASGLSAAQTAGAIDVALSTWDGTKPLRKVKFIKRSETATDPDVFDGFVPGFGDPNEATATPFQADIVEAGWRPRGFFEAVGGAGGGRSILAFTVSFIFVDQNGAPTDINGDNYFDAAFSEVYYNDNFGDPAGDRAGNPWGANILLPGVDVQTVALHENGHALGIGHFGPPPAAVMNPVYAGIRQSPFPTDLASMSAVWSSWPNQ
jgi:hypothetical protein